MARMPYVFFYGGYMDPNVLKAAGVEPENCTSGYVEGFRLAIGPLANLEQEKGAKAFGLLAKLSHEDLDKLYGGDPAHLGGAVYLPEAVLVHGLNTGAVPALTYLCAELTGEEPDQAYVDNLMKAARALGLPEDYIMSIPECIIR